MDVLVLTIFLCLTVEAAHADQEEFQRRADVILVYGKEKTLNARDRLNTRLHNVGTDRRSNRRLIKYTSITTNEECVLKRFDKRSAPVTRCEELTRQRCTSGILSYYKVDGSGKRLMVCRKI
jgi:hypothetical protein